MIKKLLAWTLLTSLSPFSAWAVSTSTKETIFNKEKGFLSCSGSAASLLFKQDCLELSLDRISFGGDIVYEGTCLDANGKKFRLSCANFVFEPDAIVNDAKKSYFDK